MNCINSLREYFRRWWACKAEIEGLQSKLRDNEAIIEELRENVRDSAVMIYHARMRLGMEGWMKVREDLTQYPTMSSILEKSAREDGI